MWIVNVKRINDKSSCFCYIPLFILRPLITNEKMQQQQQQRKRKIYHQIMLYLLLCILATGRIVISMYINDFCFPILNNNNKMKKDFFQKWWLWVENTFTDANT